MPMVFASNRRVVHLIFLKLHQNERLVRSGVGSRRAAVGTFVGTGASLSVYFRNPTVDHKRRRAWTEIARERSCRANGGLALEQGAAPCPPHGAEARPLISAPGALEVRERRFVILALRLVHNAHSLGAPEAGGEAWLSLLQLLRRRLGGVVARLLEGFVRGAAHQ